MGIVENSYLLREHLPNHISMSGIIKTKTHPHVLLFSPVGHDRLRIAFKRPFSAQTQSRTKKIKVNSDHSYNTSRPGSEGTALHEKLLRFVRKAFTRAVWTFEAVVAFAEST